jgi:hypothetical protein
MSSETNEKHNASMTRKRDRIHSEGTPVFNKHDVSIGYNCIGCRKHINNGSRMMVTYHYREDENGRAPGRHYNYERTLGKVCSEICYTMVCMRFS